MIGRIAIWFCVPWGVFFAIGLFGSITNALLVLGGGLALCLGLGVWLGGRQSDRMLERANAITRQRQAADRERLQQEDAAAQGQYKLRPTHIPQRQTQPTRH